MRAAKPDPLAKIVAGLVDCAVAWKRVATDARCSSCGSRLHRTPEDMLLYEAVVRYEELSKRRRFESEAPTTVQRRRKGS
jgi:hypothetical protein